MMSTATAKNDVDRFGMFPFRASPRQADVLIVAGTLTTKMAGPLVRLWEQMPEPKWCVAMGTCTTSGGRFKRSYSVVQGVDRVMPVDVYVPGCPPRPEGLIYGLIKLQELVKQRRGAVADLRRPRTAAARLGRRRPLTAPAAAGALVRALTDRFPDLAQSLWTDEDTVEVQADGARNIELLTVAPRRSGAQVLVAGRRGGRRLRPDRRTSRWSTTCTRTCIRPGCASAAA